MAQSQAWVLTPPLANSTWPWLLGAWLLYCISRADLGNLPAMLFLPSEGGAPSPLSPHLTDGKPRASRRVRDQAHAGQRLSMWDPRPRLSRLFLAGLPKLLCSHHSRSVEHHPPFRRPFGLTRAGGRLAQRGLDQCSKVQGSWDPEPTPHSSFTGGQVSAAHLPLC